jgi:hypothetical protein
MLSFIRQTSQPFSYKHLASWGCVRIVSAIELPAVLGKDNRETRPPGG